jgi:hypothetical protein
MYISLKSNELQSFKENELFLTIWGYRVGSVAVAKVKNYLEEEYEKY